MKKLFCSLVVLSLLWACNKEEIAPESESPSIQLTEELRLFKDETTENLDLNAAQTRNLTEALGHHGPEAEKPGFLWLVARHLQENLDPTDKHMLLDQIAMVEKQLVENGQCVPIGFEDIRKNPTQPTPEILHPLLRPAQLGQFEQAVKHHEAVHHQLVEKRIKDEITPQEFFAALRHNHHQTIARIVGEIFDESQRMQLLALMQQINEKRGQHILASYGCMTAILQLEEEEAQGILSQIMAVNQALDAHHQLLREGAATQEEVITLVQGSCNDYLSGIENELDETQLEIVSIYRALSFTRS